MSQAGIVDVISSTPTIPILFVANTGSATPAANTLNVLGTGIITTTGSGDTITISATSSAAETLTGNTGGAVSATANNINVIGDGTTITVAGNPGTSTLTISAIGTGVVDTLTGNSGGAISPSAGNINTVGTGSITVVGSGHTLTTQLTGLTNHDVLVGAGTATITSVSPSTAAFVLTSNGVGSDPSFQTVSASGAVTSLAGNSGTATPSSGVITVTTGAANTQGTAVFTGASHTLTQTFTDANLNTGLGLSVLSSLTSGADNTAFGWHAAMSVQSSTGLNAFGLNALATATVGPNDAFGLNSLFAVTTGTENVGMGSGTVGAITTGAKNTAVGYDTLSGLTTSASGNVAIGHKAGSSTYTGTESNNILIGSDPIGTTGENNVTRIGVQGSGAGQQNACFIAGIAGVTSVSSAVVAGLATGTGQLVQTTVTAGTGITVTPGAGTITISGSGTTNITVTSVNHAASPYTVLSTDDFLAVDTSGGVVTVKLPNAPATGKVYIVKDSKGTAVASNISVTTVGGAVTIDGQTTYTMATNYQSIQVVFDGTGYEVF